MQDSFGKTEHLKDYGINTIQFTKPSFIPFPFGVQRHPFPFADKSMLFYFFILNVLLCQFLFSVGLLAAFGFLAGLFRLVCLFFHHSWAIHFLHHVSLLGSGA